MEIMPQFLFILNSLGRIIPHKISVMDSTYDYCMSIDGEQNMYNIDSMIDASFYSSHQLYVFKQRSPVQLQEVFMDVRIK